MNMLRKLLTAFFLLPMFVWGVEFTFPADNNGWEGDFSDYPLHQEAFYELAWGWENLPTPLATLEKGLYLSGNNHSDDLFMFVRRKITQLKPHTKYVLSFKVLLESNSPAGSMGIGGSPGESLYFKVGGSTEKPKKKAVNGFYHLNVEKGNQAEEGANALVIGTLANPSVDPEQPAYLPLELCSERPLIVESDQNGELWIFLGTDSGFEGATKFYLAKVDLGIEPLQHQPLKTERALYLYDTGDKNMVASMFQFAKEHDRNKLEALDFRVIFMNGAIDARGEEPFATFPEKILSASEKLEVTKKVWLPVSSGESEQMALGYQQQGIEVAALRDNPSPIGDTPYFSTAEKVQRVCHKWIVSSGQFYEPSKEVIVVGSGPIEEYCEKARTIDREGVCQRLKLTNELPVVVLTGSHGTLFEERLRFFLGLIPSTPPFHLVFVPHPRDTRKMAKPISTLEALVLADAVVVLDPTSTIVYQANALKKRVLFVSEKGTRASEFLCQKELIERVASTKELLKGIQKAQEQPQDRDLFELLAIPKMGAERLWNEFLFEKQ